MANPAIATGFSSKLTAQTGPLTAPATPVFSFQPKPGGGDFSAVFQVTGTVTTLTAALQVSLDGGTTWTDYIASANFISNTTPSKTITPVVGGALYRINATVLTGSQDFWVCSN